MKQQVLKALANPARIFYVPYSLAILNFVVQFLIFIVIFVAALLVYGIDANVNPLFFLLSVIFVHFLMMGVSKKEPQLGQIVSAKLSMLKKRIPGRLVN